jgi:hypothetical protein
MLSRPRPTSLGMFPPLDDASLTDVSLNIGGTLTHSSMLGPYAGLGYVGIMRRREAGHTLH